MSLQQKESVEKDEEARVYVRDLDLYVTVQLLEGLRQSCLLDNSTKMMDISMSGLKVRNPILS